MADSVINLIIRGKDEVSGVLGNVKGSTGGLGSAFGSMQTVGMAAMGAIAVGAVALGGAIVGVGGASLSAAMDMETQMSTIAAGMNTTVEGIAPLRDLIQDLGLDPNLKVSAVEAAQAIDMLSRNGLSMEEILDGAAHSTVLLANATGATFDNAATIATDAMAIFNIEASEMGNAVNGITAVTMASKFGIEDYAMALSQGGGVAATAGVEFDEFNAAITAISPLFASGADAGTSFKTMITAIANPTDEATALMKKLGLEFYDAEGNMKSMAAISGELNQALYGVSEVMVTVGGRTAEQNEELKRLQGMYDRAGLSISDYENGIKGASLTEEARAKKIEELRLQQMNLEMAMKPLIGITGELTSTTRQLSEEERTSAMATIFGSDAMRAAAGLAAMNEESFQSLMGTMGETDALTNAATRMDNLSGVIDILKGVGESLMISLGTGLLPVFRLFADAGLALASNVLPKVESGLAIVSGVVQTFTNTIGWNIEKFGLFEGTIYAATNAVASFLPVDVAGKMWSIVDAVVVAKQTISDFLTPIMTWVSTNVELSDVLYGLGAAIAVVVVPALVSIVTAIAPVILVFGAVVGAVALVRSAWESDWQGIQGKTETVLSTIRTVITTVFTGLQTFWAAHGETIKTVANAVWGFISGVIQFQVNTSAAIVKTVFTALSAFWSAHGETIKTVASAAWEAIKTTIETITGIITELWTAFQAAREGDWTAFGEHLRDAFDIAWLAIKTNLETAWEGIKTLISTSIETVKSMFTDVNWGEVGGNIVSGIAGGITAGAGAIADAARAAASAALEAAKGFLGIESPSTVAAAQIGAPFAQGIGLGATEEMASVGGQISRALQGDLLRSPGLPGAAAPRQQIVQHTHTYHVTINDTRAMAVFLDYLQSIEGRAALEAI